MEKVKNQLAKLKKPYYSTRIFFEVKEDRYNPVTNEVSDKNRRFIFSSLKKETEESYTKINEIYLYAEAEEYSNNVLFEPDIETLIAMRDLINNHLEDLQ